MPAPTLPVEPIKAEDPAQKKKPEEEKEKQAADDKGKGKVNGESKEGQGDELVGPCFIPAKLCLNIRAVRGRPTTQE